MSREMKDSGVEWIGNIPEEWDVKRIKHAVAQMGSGTTPNSDNSNFYDGDIAWIQSGDLYNTPIITKTSRTVTEQAIQRCSALKIYHKPYIVIAMYGASVGNVSIASIDACTNQACCIVKPNDNNNIDYLKYWLEVCKTDFIRKSVGGGQPNISQDKVREQTYLCPSPTEQQQIVHFLDRKCTAIDTAIEKTKKSIEKLEEYRKSVITQAVTKGISSNSKVKTTNNKWLDEIPANWDLVRLKHMCRYISDGSHFSPQTHTDGKPYVTATNIRGIGIDYESCKKINNDDFQTLANNGCEIFKDDVLLVKDGATTGRVGYKNDDVSAVALSSVAIMRSAARVLPMYLMYYLQSEPMQQQILSSMAGSAMPRTVIAKIVNYYGVIPPLAEQQIIVSMLNDKTTEIQHSIEIHQQLIDKLKEYKQSLIYNAVTGKIDCRTEGGEVQ